MRMIGTERRVMWCAVALSAAGVLIYALGDRAMRGATVTALSLIVAGVLVARIRQGHENIRVVFSLVLTGFVLLTGANALWLVTVAIGGAEASPRPWNQLLIGVAYLFMLAAAGLGIVPTVRRDIGGVLDAATIGVAVAAALWQAILAPTLEGMQTPLADRIYVFVLLIVLSGAAGMVIGVGMNGTVPTVARPALAAFVVAILVAVVSNSLTSIFSDPGTGAPPWWAGALWPVAYAASWAAIAHPAAPQAFVVGPPRPSRLTTARIAALGLALVSTPAISVVRAFTGAHVEWLSGALAHLAVIVLVMLRVGQLAAAHRRAETRLRFLADHDGLTGLPNRRAVEHRLSALLDRVGSGKAPGAVVIFIDLNGFKQINDTLGHAVGDELLTAVGARLASLARTGDGDLVGRLGGDEFVVIIEGDPTVTAELAAVRMAGAFDRPFTIDGVPTTVAASIGAAAAGPGEPATLDALLTGADHAMYIDKRRHAARVAAQVPTAR